MDPPHKDPTRRLGPPAPADRDRARLPSFGVSAEGTLEANLVLDCTDCFESQQVVARQRAAFRLLGVRLPVPSPKCVCARGVCVCQYGTLACTWLRMSRFHIMYVGPSDYHRPPSFLLFPSFKATN